MNAPEPDMRPHGAAPTLRELLPRHLPQLETYVRAQMSRTLRDRESASDLVNSVCGDLLDAGVQFVYRDEPQFQGWLRVVVGNKIKERLRYARAKRRDEKRTELVPDAPPADRRKEPLGTASQEAALQEDLGLLDRALAELPERYRDVIVRVHLRGEPHARVAAALGRTVPGTRNMLNRALVKLVGVMDRLQGG